MRSFVHIEADSGTLCIFSCISDDGFEIMNLFSGEVNSRDSNGDTM